MTVRTKKDVNADLGEGFPNDAALMPYLSSCNIACGGHTGNKDSITKAVKRAKRYGVKIGAHPSYPDKENFGRQSIRISKEDFQASIREQLQLFQSVLESEKMEWHHVKPHGALYNDMAQDSVLSNHFLDVLKEFPTVKKVYCMAGQPIVKEIQEAGFMPIEEGFADRAYEENGTLVNRQKKEAVLEDPVAVKQQLVSFQNGTVKTINGTIIPLSIHTLCIHGDGANAVCFAKTVSKILIS